MMNSAPVPEGELVSKILLKMEGKMNRLQFTLNSESRLLLQADWEGSSCDLSLHKKQIRGACNGRRNYRIQRQNDVSVRYALLWGRLQ